MKSKIIDSHMHLSQWIGNGETLVFDAIEAYQKSNGIAYIDDMCCSNNANLWDGYEMDQSILAAIAKLENPTVFAHGCLYIPQNVEETKNYRFSDQLDELMEIGLDGIKICEFKPDAYKTLNVEKRLKEYDDFIGLCEKYGVHMCWHVADPEYFWDPEKISDSFKKKGWFYGDGKYPSYESLINLAYSMIDKHPKLNLLLAHAFFKSYDPDKAEALFEKYPNVKFDLAPGWEMFSGFSTHYNKWYNIFRKYSDRFLYATDADMLSSTEASSDIAQYVLRFLQTYDKFEVPANNIAHGIKLDKEHLENILYLNHQKSVGIEPKKINRFALKKYIDRYLPLMPDSRNKQMTEEYYRKNLL